MVVESKPFIKEESHFTDAKFYVEEEACNSIGLSMFEFKLKGDEDEDDTFIIVPPHRFTKGKLKLIFKGFSRSKKNLK